MLYICENKYVFDDEKGGCKTMGFLLFVNCLTPHVSTVRSRGIVHQDSMLPSISALARGYLLYSALELAQVKSLTVTRQYEFFFTTTVT